LFATLGFAMWTQREDQLAAIGSVAGAGPAYVARFIDALAKAGEERGLSAELARIVAVETMFGTAWMASASSESMDDIVRRVASPNGTTEAGLKVLGEGAALDALISRTIDAASKRGAELAAEARRR
jgi:pyrroline-5-carboxylate reductase